MSEDRRQILEMLAAGKITADEADRLISALGEGAATTVVPENGNARPKPKYLRVTVDEQKEGKQPTKINVRVPMQLLRAGVRLAGLIPAQAREHVEEAMRTKGFAMDLSQIRPENLEELVDELRDLTVDVDDGKAKVRVFAE